jgi:hypothetical protein
LALLAFLAAARASREKATAKDWKDRAVAEAESDVQEEVDNAKASLSQAKLHDARAKEAKKKTKARLDAIGERDESMADIVSGWRKPKSE